jgi:hypothetical protein
VHYIRMHKDTDPLLKITQMESLSIIRPESEHNYNSHYNELLEKQAQSDISFNNDSVKSPTRHL